MNRADDDLLDLDVAFENELNLKLGKYEDIGTGIIGITECFLEKIVSESLKEDEFNMRARYTKVGLWPFRNNKKTSKIIIQNHFLRHKMD